ncbi:PPE family protein [Mycobacterium kubicae]|uniref:PPE family protein n=1 Tax=Mycobacterium kubicae TaxID=120959 RepID=UPI0016409F07|nr:PPE family protein [Mycobacterium kubicae]QNI07076.1 PPE family protein [Mycobacterium kubicae]
MSFAFRPPEIISGEMYTGPGSGPMLAAATAWDALAAELQDTAASYGSIVEGLANESWTGPSSVAMATAAAPYVAWMSATSAQAKAAADQAKAAAGAYETAFAAVVPPPEIAANRALLAMLVATNIFGQNTGAIAATEAQYAEMWAQDTAAMLSYAGSSATASRLTPFTEPPQTTNASGLANQAAASGQSAGLAGATGAVANAVPSAAALPFPFDIVTQLLQALGSGSTAYMQFWNQFLNTVTGTPLAGITWENTFGIFADIGRFSTVANDSMSPINLGMTEFKMFYKPPVEALDIPKSALGAGLGLRPAGLTSSTAVSAGVGDANLVGRLSVPPSWASATPAIRLASAGLPATSLAAAPAAGIPGNLLSQMALGSLTGGALGAVGPQVLSGSGARARANGGKGSAEPVKLDSVIAKLQKEPESVQHWNVDKAGLDNLLEKLSKEPGIHAVHVTNGDKPKVTLPDVPSR